MANKTPITLRITNPDGTTSESSSDLESVIVGSGAAAAIKISDPKVSNLHVMLKVEKSGQVTAIDLGSEHGTRFKDQVIKDPVTLISGDTLTVGASEVRVVFGEQKAPEKSEKVNGNGAHHVNGSSESHEKKKATKTVPAPPAALAGTGANASMLFNEPLSAEATPSEDSKVLQVALLWGDTLINVRHFADGVPVSIGDGAGVAFNVFASDVGQNFNLAVSKGANAVINVPNAAGLVLSKGDDTRKTKEQLKSEGKLKGAEGGLRADAVELGLHDRAQVSFEDVAFIIRYVRPSAAVQVNTLEEADFTFFKITSVCLMAFVALVAAMLLGSSGDNLYADDIFQNPSKYVKLMIKAEKKQEVKKIDLSGIKEGAKPKDDEGKFGKVEAKKKDADPSKKGAPVVDANKREEDRKKVMSAGLLGAMNGAASNVFGPGGLGTGVNDALGGLKGGAGVGDAHGIGGLGSRGAGAGGGGTGLGLGGLGTKGGGRGAGGYGNIDLGGRGKDVTRVIPGKTTVVGGLSKADIEKVIRRHQNEIKFCYEQELQKTTDLAGKVAVLFNIDTTGTVVDANVSESTLGNNNAESCMLSRIRRWKFPESQGGVTTVTYPWIFKPAGSGGDDAAE